MVNELVIINARRTSGFSIPTSRIGVQWTTCLRRIHLLNGSEFRLIRGQLKPEEEIYRGVEAYRFLLEVVCGLHSPIIGETEVMGQFREFCTETEFPATPWGYELKQTLRDLLADAKRVRHQHLHDQGSQSYGSLAARYLRGVRSVIFLGAGKLVREMIPWLLAQSEVTIVNRSQGSAERLREEYPGLRIAGVEEAFSVMAAGEASLVVAAPLAARDISDWVSRRGASFARILDLRGESAQDPLRVESEVLDLQAFFALLEGERRRAEEISARAGEEVRRCAARYLKQMQCRPFGWEDLCA